MDAVFTGSMTSVCGGLVFTALLGWACVSDFRTRRIPNRLVLMLAIGGLLFSLLYDRGLPRALLGLLVGFALWIPFYALRVLGAGDVKLFAAAAAWLGPRGALEAAVLAAAAGGVLAVLVALHAGVLGKVLHSLPTRLTTRATPPAERAFVTETPSHLPYGIALAAGAILAGWFPPFVW